MNPYLLAFLKVVMPRLVWIMALLIPGRDRRIAVRECRNKLWIMELVNEVASVLPPPGTYLPLPELVDKSYALGPFPALWAVEGLGHYYGETFYERQLEPKDLLTSPEVASIPEKSLTMLHAGIGLSFAKHCLEKVGPKSPPEEIRSAVARFVELCRGSSRPGYTGAAIESLGLVSRFVHGPKMVRLVEGALSEIDPELVGYLWHGVGRALYFSPPNFLPGVRSPWRAVAMSRSESGHEPAQMNMLAGLAWAIMLVNMRNPEVMEAYLKHHGGRIPGQAHFNGVASSLIMRYDTSPDDPNIKPFCDYAPNASDPIVVRLWNDLVESACSAALERFYPVLKQHRRLEEVFHYRDLEGLVKELAEEGRPQAR